MVDIENALAPIRSRLAAATPRPWFCEDGPWQSTIEGYFDAEGQLAFKHGEGWEADAALIAAAPTDLVRLLAAVDAVVALHEPVPHYLGANYKDLCGTCWNAWPCPTVAALTIELEENH